MKWLWALLLIGCTTDEITVKIVKHMSQREEKTENTYLVQDKDIGKKKCPGGCKAPLECNEKTGKCEAIAVSVPVKEGHTAIYINTDYGGENRASPEDY